MILVRPEFAGLGGDVSRNSFCALRLAAWKEMTPVLMRELETLNCL